MRMKEERSSKKILIESKNKSIISKDTMAIFTIYASKVKEEFGHLDNILLKEQS